VIFSVKTNYTIINYFKILILLIVFFTFSNYFTSTVHAQPIDISNLTPEQLLENQQATADYYMSLAQESRDRAESYAEQISELEDRWFRSNTTLWQLRRDYASELENIKFYEINALEAKKRVKELEKVIAERDNAPPEEQEELQRQIDEIESQRQQSIQDTQQALGSNPDSVQSQRDTGCSMWPGGGFDVYKCMATVMDGMYSVVLWALSWVLALADTLFATVVEFSIINFKEFIDDIQVVDLAWKAARDVANIFFIFVLLYLAASTILQSTSVDTKKMLVYVIVTALLINFSATFTKVAIDASNITAVTFYNLIGKDGEEPDLSAYFRDSLSWFEGPNRFGGGPDDVVGGNQASGQVGNPILMSLAKNIGLTFLLIITLFTILAASLLLLIRAVALIFIIITSPLAFISFIFAPLKPVFSIWLNRLKCDLLFAPLFFFLLYLTFGLMDSVYGSDKTVQINTASEHIFMFLILNGLMLGSIIVAQKVGCQMGGSAANFVKNKTRALTVGAAALGARNSIGRGASRLAKTDFVQRNTAKRPRLFGGTVRRGLNKASNAKFGGTTGYAEAVKNRQEGQQGVAKDIKDPALKTQFISNLNPRDSKKAYEALSDREKADLEMNAIKEGNTALIESLKNLRTGLKGEDKDKANKEFGKQYARHIQTREVEATNPNAGRPGEPDTIMRTQTIEEQVGHFESITDEDNQKVIYENLSDADKAKFESAANTQASKDNFKTLRSGLSEENQQKIAEAAKKIKKNEANKAVVETVDALNSWAKDPDNAPGDLDRHLTNFSTNFRPQNTDELDVRTLTQDGVIDRLGKADLVHMINKRNDFKAEDWAKIINRKREQDADELRDLLSSPALSILKVYDNHGIPDPNQGNNSGSDEAWFDN